MSARRRARPLARRRRQALSRRPRAEGRLDRDPAGRGGRPDRRERRRQVDADEDPRRRLPARFRRDPASAASRPRFANAADANRQGHRHGVPGAVAADQPDRRREHLSRQRGAVHPLRHRRLARALRRRGAPARQGRGRRRSAHAHRRPRLRHAPDGRARQGADARGAAPAATSSSCSTSRPRCSSAPRSTSCSRACGR